MIKIIFEMSFLFLATMLLLTQVILPSFSKLPYFWLFKRKNEKSSQPAEHPVVSTLDELEKEVDSSVEQMKQTKDKVDAVAEKVAEMKQKTK